MTAHDERSWSPSRGQTVAWRLLLTHPSRPRPPRGDEAVKR